MEQRDEFAQSVRRRMLRFDHRLTDLERVVEELGTMIRKEHTVQILKNRPRGGLKPRDVDVT